MLKPHLSVSLWTVSNAFLHTCSPGNSLKIFLKFLGADPQKSSTSFFSCMSLEAQVSTRVQAGILPGKVWDKILPVILHMNTTCPQIFRTFWGDFCIFEYKKMTQQSVINVFRFLTLVLALMTERSEIIEWLTHWSHCFKNLFSERFHL